MKLLQSRLARYILTGGLSFTIELSALLTLNAMGFHRAVAVGISFWIGFIVALLLQKIFAFQDYRRQARVIAKQTLAFSLLVAFNYFFTIGLVALFPEKYIVISRTAAVLIVSIWNYYLYKNFIFSDKKSFARVSPSLSALMKSSSYKNFFHQYIIPNRKSILFYLGCSAIVIIFFWQYIVTGSKTFMGDFDYYSQQYEAFRISVINYGQFPAWNPWLSGGIPLWQNPQFGLISLQSLLVLLFGTLIGMKIAYITYALLGFWGMYILCKKTFDSDRLRAALISFIWVFSGFFTGHTIGHFTFTSFFLLPWIIYFIFERRRMKYAWLGLGGVMAAITLSSVHYATMFTPLIIAAYLGLSLIYIRKSANGLVFGFNVQLADIYFALKSAFVFILLAGWQFIATYHFVSGNERLIHGGEVPPTLDIIFQAIFMPVDTLLEPPKTTWGWGEYSMYIGFATLLAVLLISVQAVRTLIIKRGTRLPMTRPFLVCTALVVGAVCAVMALGDFSNLSPFHLLHDLPGFSQTRVPSRWVLYTIFGLLLLIASWKGQRKAINGLLLFSAIELFISFGPLRFHGQNWVTLPQTAFSSELTQHDNNFQHHLRPDILMNYYLYTTSQNIGQIYADDSLINTLSSTPLLESSRCANNTDSSCSFVRTKNAVIKSWSPNKIVVKRTGPGEIRLNMNVEAGWRVNGKYIYALNRKLDPKLEFTLPDGENVYELEYAPKFSPSWIIWRLSRL